MISVLDNTRSKRVLVVAHPADETLYCAGLLQRYPGDWSIVACSQPRKGGMMALKFLLACRALNARGCVLGNTEASQLVPLELDQIEFDEVDLIVTHGPHGEFGDMHHKQVHDRVRSIAPSGVEVLTIGYGRFSTEKPPLTFELTDKEWNGKLNALHAYNTDMCCDGVMMPEWEMLLERYGTPGRNHGFDLRIESYDRA